MFITFVETCLTSDPFEVVSGPEVEVVLEAELMNMIFRLTSLEIAKVLMFEITVM
jgi:hypothetical protein